MNCRFDPRGGLIVVSAEVAGPTGSAVVRLALDTGATCTLMSPTLLTALGYDLALSEKRIEMTTGSGVEYAVRIDVEKVTALGAARDSLPVLAHSLPPSAGVDGLLGVDFFAGRRLTIDFSSGELELA